MGDFELGTFSVWGGAMIRYLAWAGVVACLAIPLGIVRLLAGALIGGVLMLGVTLGKDALDLANMDAEMSSAMELVGLTAGGRLFGVGVLLLVVVGLVSAIPIKRKIPADREADGDLRED